jgi:hypothetical protein
VGQSPPGGSDASGNAAAPKASILERLATREADIPTLVGSIHSGLDPRRTKAAGLSVLAHLGDLTARGPVVTQGAPAIDGHYRVS